MSRSRDSGSGAARLARRVRDAEAGGSNPLSPTRCRAKPTWNTEERHAAPFFVLVLRDEISAGDMNDDAFRDQQNALRTLPSISRLVQHPDIIDLARDILSDIVVDIARQQVAIARERLLRGEVLNLDELLSAVRDELRQLQSPRGTVINGTGVIVQTNLGRAPVSRATADAMRDAASRYVPLETWLDTGTRGGRGQDVSTLMRVLTGAERTLVVNNNAAAVLLMLSALGSRREVVVSRGEAVEIGGGFRVPDVMRQSGATLVEVGTTNRTYAVDYENATNDRTAGYLRVHTSNFQIIGFVASPLTSDLARIAHDRGVLLLEDAGSGCLIDTTVWGLAHEQTLRESIGSGVDVVCASGDKLLGGPQAGLILGRADLVDRIARHPLARAVRADKTTLAGIAATLRHYIRGDEIEDIPVWWSVARSEQWLRSRAETWQQRVGEGTEVAPSISVVGGGSMPGQSLPSWALAIDSSTPGADELARRLRMAPIPVIPRVENDRVMVDARTVLPDEDDSLIETVRRVLHGPTA